MIFSNTEFYYCSPDQITDSKLILKDDEAKHLIQVMRNSIGDLINVTNGIGNIFECEITEIFKREVKLKILNKINIKNELDNITFYIPILKKSDRLEFALEKCVELGITNFVIYSAEKSYKRGVKLVRFERILISAMKQSLRAYKPKLIYKKSLSDEILQNSQFIYFDQLAELKLTEYLSKNNIKNNSENIMNFVFGPEGGNTKNELAKLDKIFGLRLTQNRLRSETAIIAAASIISTSY